MFERIEKETILIGTYHAVLQSQCDQMANLLAQILASIEFLLKVANLPK